MDFIEQSKTDTELMNNKSNMQQPITQYLAEINKLYKNREIAGVKEYRNN
jgi:hypothetical protein